MIFWLMILAIAGQPEAAASLAAITSNETVSPAMAAAIENKRRAKTAPSFIEEPDYVRPEVARLAGEFGEVVLTGIIGEDGRVHEPKIKVSSRSAAIDAAALAAVPSMLFEPGRDADGKPLSLASSISLEYGQTDFHGPRSLAQYKCDQFVRDYDWWYRTWAVEKQDRIFKTLRGYAVLTDMRSGDGSRTDFDTEWKNAIKTCRAAPDKLMLDTLKPHGSLFRRMVAR